MCVYEKCVCMCMCVCVCVCVDVCMRGEVEHGASSFHDRLLGII